MPQTAAAAVTVADIPQTGLSGFVAGSAADGASRLEAVRIGVGIEVSS